MTQEKENNAIVDSGRNGKALEDILRDELIEIKREARMRDNERIRKMCYHAVGELDNGNVVNALKTRNKVLDRTRNWDM